MNHGNVGFYRCFPWMTCCRVNWYQRVPSAELVKEAGWRGCPVRAHSLIKETRVQVIKGARELTASRKPPGFLGKL